MADILDKRFGLRSLLDQEEFHTLETSIPKEALTPDREPNLRDILSGVADYIVANPTSILTDTYSVQERKKDWQSLLTKPVLEKGEILAIDARSRPGHKLMDHHMPHFWSVKNYKGVSVKSLITKPNLEKALMTNVMMHSTPYRSELRRMLIMTGGLGNVTKYRTVTAKAIVTYFGAKRVLDPCIGWGGRMLGALAAGADYVGCEPDPSTMTGLKGILADLPTDIQSKATVLEAPAEQALVSMEGDFDLVLTSPPYFHLEQYTGGTQSTGTHPTWEAWSNQWLKPLVLRCLSLLKPDGVSCWSVKNFKTNKLYPLADLVKRVHSDAGWTLVKTVVMKGSARPGAGRIQKGKATRDSEEETFCFRCTPKN